MTLWPRRTAVLVLLLLNLPGRGTRADDHALAARFAEPPAESRILKIIHSWPDAAKDQDELIRTLSRQAFGGVVCNVSFDNYLESAEKWRSFESAVARAKQAGWTLWLYDERGYPSGNAGGLVLRGHPEWEASGLLLADAGTEGAAVTVSVPPGQLWMAAGYPVRDGQIDPEKRMDLGTQIHDGRLHWQPPPGRWHVLVVTRYRLYEGTHAVSNVSGTIPCANLLMPEPTSRFLQVTHQAYADHFGPDLGKIFVSTFTDEPSLMSVLMKPMPYRVLPWAPALPGEFERRRGYALEPVIADLILDAGAAGRKHRYDYWQTIGELVAENYFGQIQRWCRAHGILSGGHLLMEESVPAHVPLYGDFFACARRLDAPSIDCLSSLPPDAPWYIARLLASAAELEGKTVVMSETSDHAQRYRPRGDTRPVRDVTEAEMRGTFNRLFLGGVNCITSYYSYAGLNDEAIRRLNAYVGRCATLLRGGNSAAEIALVYPIQSVWPRFVPSHEWTKEAHGAARIDRSFHAAMDALYASRREFSIVDARAICEAEVTNGSMVHRSARWRVIVLPGVDTLPSAAWQKLGQFVQSGGVLIALGSLPANSEREFPSPRVQALGRTIFGTVAGSPSAWANPAGGGGIFLPDGSEGLLALAIKGVLPADLTPDDPRAPLRMTHRRVQGKELYFVINDSPQAWRGRFRIPARGQAERWDPGSGKTERFNPADPISVSIEPYGATFVCSPQEPSPAQLPLKSGSLPGLELRHLPEASAEIPHGQYVTAQLRRVDSSDGPAAQRFENRSTITRSRVDTFSFVTFHYPEPINLASDDCLAVDTWVAAAQRSHQDILVILQVQGGGDFVAATGLTLGDPGQRRAIVALDRFTMLNPGSRGADRLDLTRISAIGIGWGGYLGEKDEEVRFQVAPPRAGQIAVKGLTGR